jgi:hypothetical protein
MGTTAPARLHGRRTARYQLRRGTASSGGEQGAAPASVHNEDNVRWRARERGASLGRKRVRLWEGELCGRGLRFIGRERKRERAEEKEKRSIQGAIDERE